MEKPLISVVMSVFNAEKYLKEAIDSILTQTYRNYEFIIIDDGSLDSSKEIIEKCYDERIIKIYQENKGLSAALNTGIKRTSGKYIARLDADDIAVNNRFEMQVDFLEKNSQYVLIGSNANVIDAEGEYLYTSQVPVEEEQIRKKLSNTSPFYHSSVMYLKEVFDKCGGYNEKIRHHVEDLILWNKMAQYGKIGNLSEPLIKYRLVPNAITNRSRASADFMIELAGRIIKGEEPAQSEFEKLEKLTSHRTSKQKSALYYSNLGCIFLYRRKDKKKAFRNFLSALRNEPFKLSYGFLTLLSVMPLCIVNRWMKFRNIDVS